MVRKHYKILLEGTEIAFSKEKKIFIHSFYCSDRWFTVKGAKVFLEHKELKTNITDLKDVPEVIKPYLHKKEGNAFYYFNIKDAKLLFSIVEYEETKTGNVF